MAILTVIPAYGRNYITKEQVLLDWEQNLDFKIIGGPYVNKQQVDQVKEDGYEEIRFVYGKSFNELKIRL